jgi:hypothetical protein
MIIKRRGREEYINLSAEGMEMERGYGAIH